MQQNLRHVSQDMVQHLPKGNYHVRQAILHKYLHINTNVPFSSPCSVVHREATGMYTQTQRVIYALKAWEPIPLEIHPDREGRRMFERWLDPVSSVTPQHLIQDRGPTDQRCGGKKWENQEKEKAKAMATCMCPLKLEWMRTTFLWGDCEPG